MNRMTVTCLLAALALPVAIAAQGNPPPPPAAAVPSPGQNQQPPPGGRGGRGAAMPAQAPTPAPPEGQRGGRGAGMPMSRFDDKAMQNVRVDVTLTDTLASESPAKKTVTIVVVDGNAGAIRSTSGPQTLNVDVQPHVRSDGKIFVSFSLQYYPEAGPGPAGPGRVPAVLNESLSVIVADGKPMVVSQSADPRSDRKVAVELTATVVK
jgi:hypothetical protein